MEALKDEFDMLAIDLRGYGQSPPSADSVTLADHAHEIAAIAKQLDFSFFTLVGHSLGGAVVMQFAALYPQMLSGLVLLDSAPVDGMKNIDYSIVQMMLDNQNILLAALKATMAKPVDDDIWAEFTKDCLKSAPAVMPNTRALDGADFSQAAKSFTKPVLVIHGEHDKVVPPAEAEKTAAAYPQSKLVIIPGVGHNPQMEDTEAFVKVLRNFAQGCDN